MDWIDATFMVPDHDIAVLIATADGDVIAGCHHAGTWVDIQARRQIFRTVTHWRPYPLHPNKTRPDFLAQAPNENDGVYRP